MGQECRQSTMEELQKRIQQLEEQLRRRDQETQEKIRDLETILRLSALINSALDLKTVLDNIMHAAEQLTGAETSSLLLYDEETDELYFSVARGEKGEALEEIRLKRGEGIAGYVLETGEPVLVQDVRTDPRHAVRVDQTSGFVTRNLIAVPLRIDHTLKGVLEVLNKKEGTFTQHDLEDLMSLSVLSAIAIDKAQAHQDLQQLFEQAIRALVSALDARDPYTRGHSERVTDYSVTIAQEMGLNRSDVERIRLSALLHDIGKVGVPDAILLKDGRLTDQEYEIIKQHPEIGYRVLRNMKRLGPYLDGVRYHHERLSGRGYPLGLMGDAIPLDARVIAVADVYDACTSDRPYRKAFPPEKALKILNEGKGTEFDPVCVEAFERAFHKGLVGGRSYDADAVSF
ncbi:MAG: HD domain-containing protein [Armatimonadetes bacterium]|nr:HD domain-containing protein [Armatimonadota bacterium]MDW8122287.1 HD domain-containing protein [Armatimonadota bacterium]